MRWLSRYMDVCYFYPLPGGPFSEAGQKQKKETNKNFSVNLSAMDGLLMSCFSVPDLKRTTPEKRKHILYLSLFTYAQINSVAHVYRPEMCNQNLYPRGVFFCVLPFQPLMFV